MVHPVLLGISRAKEGGTDSPTQTSPGTLRSDRGFSMPSTSLFKRLSLASGVRIADLVPRPGDGLTAGVRTDRNYGRSYSVCARAPERVLSRQIRFLSGWRRQKKEGRSPPNLLRSYLAIASSRTTTEDMEFFDLFAKWGSEARNWDGHSDL